MAARTGLFGTPIATVSCPVLHTYVRICILLLVVPAGLGWTFVPAAHAQVSRVEVLSREAMHEGQPVGDAGVYEVLRGRVYGEVDPNDPHNRIIQDIERAPTNARGRVEYVSTFALAKPRDPVKSSGTLVYYVVNRGNGDITASTDGHMSLVSGWQGDLEPTATTQTLVVPTATHEDGSAITGPVLARFYDIGETNTAPIRLNSMGNGRPSAPASLDEAEATLTTATSETTTGVKGGVSTVPRAAWAFADCRTTPFPGEPDPARLCLKDGFHPNTLYELVYTAKDPLVLGLGLAVTRDINAFFRYATEDSTGAPNPVGDMVDHAISIGNSQSGNFIKTVIHLGFNEDLDERIVWDGVFPRIAARQTPINYRFAQPGGAGRLYEPGSEPVVWWGRYEDTARQRTAASMLDRCTTTNTCPKVIEAFTAAEFWGLRMSAGLIGTDAVADIPLPSNVRRYYHPGTTHGGGRGGFQIESGPARGCALPSNPNPASDTTRALTEALIHWVADGTPPPASRYPTLADGVLVPARTAVLGFPDVPGARFDEAEVNPVLDYDFGPEFDANDMSGVITREPPGITQVIPTYVPRVNEDGNETSGVPSVLHQAPLGTYLGWNLTASGFFAGQICGFQGGYVPFPKTRAERLDTGDPRRSVEERYGTLEGYMCVVESAAAKAVSDRFLLEDDAARLIEQARQSGVLPPDADSSPANQDLARTVCSR